MTFLLEAFNKIQCLSAAGSVSSLMVTEYKCSGRQENPDHRQQWEVKINLKSILQAFTSTSKISLFILSLRLFWIAVPKWGQSLRVNDCVAALKKEIIMLVLAVYSQLENICFFPFSMWLPAQVSPVWYLQSVQKYWYVFFWLEIAPSSRQIVKLRGKKKKRSQGTRLANNLSQQVRVS